ncbi:MAG: hypothetical protein J0M03_24185 [Acidobacteria bacterium]|nr:hypothetical protein [Acidobacteriota bacterium]
MQLIRQAVRKLSDRWNVIVSVRIYDAKKSQDLLDLFPSSLSTDNSTNYRHSEISCRHFMVTNLEYWQRETLDSRTDVHTNSHVNDFCNFSEKL